MIFFKTIQVFISRGLTSISGLILLIYISLYLDELERGFYYTLQAIGGIQIFFELGLSQSLLYFFSRFSGRLSQNNKKIYALISQSSRYIFMISSYLYIIAVIIFGFFTVNFDEQDINKFFFLIIIVGLSGASNIWLQLRTIHLEARGLAAFVARSKFFSTIFSISIVSILCKLINPLASLLSFQLIFSFLTFIFLYFNKSKHYQKNSLKRSKASIKVLINSWKKEIGGFHFKIAISWICGYLGIQSTTLVFYKLFGSSAAGKYGYSVTIFNSLLMLCTSLMLVRLPDIARLISSKKILKANRLAIITISQVTILFSFLSVFIFLVLIFIGQVFNIQIFDGYLLSNTNSLLIMINMIISTFLTCLGMYMRAYLKEPFLIISIIQSLGQLLIIIFAFSKFPDITKILELNLLLTISISILALFKAKNFFNLQIKDNLSINNY